MSWTVYTLLDDLGTVLAYTRTFRFSFDNRLSGGSRGSAIQLSVTEVSLLWPAGGAECYHRVLKRARHCQLATDSENDTANTARMTGPVSNSLNPTW